MKTDPLRNSWKGMISRCHGSQNYPWCHYGGRGIVVCDRWRDKKTGFASFCADMGPKPSRRHSLDRINNDGNYEPGNCRWATPRQQQLNKRRGTPRPVLISFHISPDDLAVLRREWADAMMTGTEVTWNAFVRHKLTDGLVLTA